MEHKHYKVTVDYYNALQNNGKNQQWRIPNKAGTELLVCVCMGVQNSIASQYEITKEQFDTYLLSSAWQDIG